MTITLAIVIFTCLLSISAISNSKLMDDLIFYAPAIAQRKQYYRFLSHGFIHADYIHLAFNMIALYSFGEAVEVRVRHQRKIILHPAICRRSNCSQHSRLLAAQK